MVVAGSRSLLFILLMAASLALTLVPQTTAQGVCDENPDLPTCMEPDVQVEVPQTVDAHWATGIWNEAAAILTFPVNVSYGNDAALSEDETLVTVEPGSTAGLTATGGEATITPGETATINVELNLTLKIPAGENPLPLYVNTTGTNVHRSTTQTQTTVLEMPWWFQHQGADNKDVREVEEGIRSTLELRDFQANGPVDLLIVVPNGTHTPEPEIIRTSEILRPGEPVTGEWDLTFYGEDTNVRFRLYWVAQTDEGLRCFDSETGGPLMMEDGQPGEECAVLMAPWMGVWTPGIGGFAGLLFLTTSSLVFLGMIGAIALGFFVLRRGGRRFPSLTLGIYLIMAGIGFGLAVLDWITQEAFGLGLDTVVPSVLLWPLIGMAWMLLPTTLLLFALGHPIRHPRLRNMKHWQFIPFIPWMLFSPLLFYTIFTTGNDDLALTLVFLYILATTSLAAWIYWDRSRKATTRLEQSRHRYMLRYVALPLAAGATLVLVVVNLDTHLLANAIWNAGLAGILMAIVALGPVTGMAFGLLRYKIVDLDTKLRLTINRGFIGAVFIAVFFLTTEIAKLTFSEAIGPVVGLLAAALLVAMIAPLERVGRRLAQQVVPEPPDPQAYQSFRRLEIYRAAFEEVAADDQVSEKERRAMDSLARTLKLSPDEVKFVETEVEKERETITRTRQAPAASEV